MAFVPAFSRRSRPLASAYLIQYCFDPFGRSNTPRGSLSLPFRIPAPYHTRRVRNKGADANKGQQNRATVDIAAEGVQAAARLLNQELAELHHQGTLEAHAAHCQIENAELRWRGRIFYQRLVPWRRQLIAVLARAYGRLLRVALANAARIEGDAHSWALGCTQPTISAVVEEIKEWTRLACDGENRSLQLLGTVEYEAGKAASMDPIAPPGVSPGKDWRAPAWLFLHYAPASGIGPLKTHHATPDAGADVRLGAAYTRLTLGGLRRIFLAELRGALERARDEEIAAHAASAQPPPSAPPPRRPSKRAGWERKERLLALIRDILDRQPGLQGAAFCAELDRHHAPPLSAWEQSGEWDGLTFKAAWKQPRLRKKIRRVRQEAMRPSCAPLSSPSA